MTHRILLVDVSQMLKDLLLSAYPGLPIAGEATANDDLERIVADTGASLVLVGSHAGSQPVRRLLEERARLRVIVLSEGHRTLLLHELSVAQRRLEDVSLAELGALVATVEPPPAHAGRPR